MRDKVDCPVLFLTARVNEQGVVNGPSSGGNDYILKPFGLKESDTRITAHLKREAQRKNRTQCCFQGDSTTAFLLLHQKLNTTDSQSKQQLRKPSHTAKTAG